MDDPWKTEYEELAGRVAAQRSVPRVAPWRWAARRKAARSLAFAIARAQHAAATPPARSYFARLYVRAGTLCGEASRRAERTPMRLDAAPAR